MEMKRYIFFLCAVVFVYVATACVFVDNGATKSNAVPLNSLNVVLDAGHGGIDVGAVGVNGTIESDLNLAYCQMLKGVLEDYGVNVVMTRETKDGLYSEFKNGFKREDMTKRKEIIISVNPDAVISIHMNKYSASSSRGAQVFYDDEKGTGKVLAETLQEIFKKHLNFTRNEAQAGDLYILKCIDKPSILVECGFLSNPDEEKLLTTRQYQKKLCLCICSAILAVTK